MNIENRLTFLAAPLNDHALLGALRSPMFAIGDDSVARHDYFAYIRI